MDFVNAVLKNQKIVKGEQILFYNLNMNRIFFFNMLNDIRKHVTLLQLIDSLGNVNHDTSVVGYCIFDSNYEK